MHGNRLRLETFARVGFILSSQLRVTLEPRSNLKF